MQSCPFSRVNLKACIATCTCTVPKDILDLYTNHYVEGVLIEGVT